MPGSVDLLSKKWAFSPALRLCLGLAGLLMPSIASAGDQLVAVRSDPGSSTIMTAGVTAPPSDCLPADMPTSPPLPGTQAGVCPDLVVLQIATPFGIKPGWENSVLVQVSNRSDRPTSNPSRVRIATHFDSAPSRSYVKNLGAIAGNQSLWVSLDCFEVPRIARRTLIVAEADPKGDCGSEAKGCVDEGGGNLESNNSKQREMSISQLVESRGICAKYGKTLPEK